MGFYSLSVLSTKKTVTPTSIHTQIKSYEKSFLLLTFLMTFFLFGCSEDISPENGIELVE